MKTFQRLLGLCMLIAAFAMVSSIWNHASAQKAQTLKGVVIDENGEPIIGAAVFVVETNSGAVTDLDGNFTVDAAVGNILEANAVFA